MFMEGMCIFAFSSAKEELAASAPLNPVLDERLDFHLPSHSLLNPHRTVRLKKANDCWPLVGYRCEKTFIVSGWRNSEAVLSEVTSVFVSLQHGDAGNEESYLKNSN